MKFLFYLLILCVFAGSAHDLSFFDMIDAKGKLRLLAAIPGFVWSLAATLIEVIFYWNTRKEILEKYDKFRSLWNSLIILTCITGFFNLLSGTSIVFSVFSILSLIAWIVITTILGVKLYNNYTGRIRKVGSMFKYAPIVCSCLCIFVFFLLPDSYGELTSHSYETSHYRIVRESHSTSTIVWTLVLIILDSLIVLLPAWACCNYLEPNDDDDEEEGEYIQNDQQDSEVTIDRTVHDEKNYANLDCDGHEITECSNQEQISVSDEVPDFNHHETTCDNQVKRVTNWNKKIIIGALGLIIVLLGILIYLIVDSKKTSYSDKVKASYEIPRVDDEYNSSSAEEADENNEITVEQDNYSLPEDVYDTLPEWMPSDFMISMNESELKLVGPSYVRELLRGMSEFTDAVYYGTFGNSKIKMILNIDYDGNVSGKYAYLSTLDKYGDVKSSWFPLKGSVMARTDDYGNYNDFCIALQSYNPENGNLFEFGVLYWNGPDTWSGRFSNVRHRGSPSEKYYSVTVSQ